MPKFAANLTMMFNEVDFLDRFAAASRAGFGAVEYLFPYPYPAALLAEKLAEHRLAQVLFNLPAGNWAKGERGIACHPDRVSEFRDGAFEAIAYAKVLDCRQVNCLAGLTPPDMPREQVHEVFVENLRFAAAQLAKAQVKLLVEPINTRDIPGFYLSRSAPALAIMDEVGSDNIALQYDIYHMQIMEGDLAPTLSSKLDRIKHVQIADTPGRHEPGTGEINYEFLFQHLDRIGYPGWIGCEYKPIGRTEDGLGWFSSYREQRAAA
jgi:hydroxypyruvate isomerase